MVELNSEYRQAQTYLSRPEVQELRNEGQSRNLRWLNSQEVTEQSLRDSLSYSSGYREAIFDYFRHNDADVVSSHVQYVGL